MFGNTGNNNRNEVSVNTRIRTFYSDISCLQLSYWNENMSIKINPLQSVTAEGIRQYDFNRRANTALTSDKAIALQTEIEKKLLPEIEKVKQTGKLEAPVNVGLPVGNKGSAIFFEYKNDEKEEPSVYLTIYTNIGQDNVAPKDGVYSYKFNKVKLIDNYDPENGTGTDSYVESEFLFVYNKLKTIADVFGNAAHSVNSEKAYHGNSNNYQRGGYNANSNSTPQQQASSSYSAPVSSFDVSELPFN